MFYFKGFLTFSGNINFREYMCHFYYCHNNNNRNGTLTQNGLKSCFTDVDIFSGTNLQRFGLWNGSWYSNRSSWSKWGWQKYFIEVIMWRTVTNRWTCTETSALEVWALSSGIKISTKYLETPRLQIIFITQSHCNNPNNCFNSIWSNIVL